MGEVSTQTQDGEQQPDPLEMARRALAGFLKIGATAAHRSTSGKRVSASDVAFMQGQRDGALLTVYASALVSIAASLAEIRDLLAEQSESRDQA